MKVPVCASLLCALVLASCAGDVRSSATTSPSVVAATAAPSTIATSSPSASPSPQLVAFPDLPFIVGTNAGDLYFQLINGQPSGRKVHACDGAIANLVANGRQALFLCYSTGIPTLYLYDDDTGTVAAIVKTESAVYALTGTGQAVYETIGQTVPTAPISMTKLMLLDLRTRATTTIDERFGVAFELRPTGEGLLVWRPKNSLSFIRPDADAGSWILNGSTLVKLSQFRLIEGGTGRALLESEAIDPATGYFAGACCTYVYWKTASEQRLPPSDVRNERGLAVLDDGRAVTWRPEAGEFEGSVVIYSGMKVERVDRGRFSSFRALRSGDWIVSQELSGAPSLTLHAYRISDGAFAATSASAVSTLTILGPKK